MREKILQNYYQKILPLKEVKHFLRITGEHEDELVSNLCKTVIKSAEMMLAFELSHKEIMLYGHFENNVKLKSPLVSVLSVKSNAKNVDFRIEKQILKPSVKVGENLEICYEVGLMEDEVPDDLKSAIIQHLISLYDLRISGGKLPHFSVEVYNRYRMVNL
jgi:hypothetical protein